tara:strand:- start:3029 stop:4372 length:1344 start_codon:yes stop_codon:yes gene_type:complete
MMDMYGMNQLYKTPQEIGMTLRRAAADRGLVVRVAVSATQTAALLITQARSGLTIVPVGSEAAVLGPLPVTVLRKLAQVQNSNSDENNKRQKRYQRDLHVVRAAMSVPVGVCLSTIQRWGIKTLGELAALPAQQLFGRLGSIGRVLQRIARGQDEGPLVCKQGRDLVEQAVTFDWPIDRLELLSFELGRLLHLLCETLEYRGECAGAVHIQLILVSGEKYKRSLRFATPLRDAQKLCTLILLDLETNQLPEGINGMTVKIDPVPNRKLQYSLFTPAVPSPEILSILVARLRVLVGAGRCGVAELVNSHYPGAFKMQEFRPKLFEEKDGKHCEDKEAVLRLLPAVIRRFRMPVRAHVTVGKLSGKPVSLIVKKQRVASGRIVASSGPWRSSGNWWEGDTRNVSRDRDHDIASHPWNRDEWDVVLSGGSVYRLFRDRLADKWFVEGVMD